MAKPEKQETTVGKTYNKYQQKRPQRKKDTRITPPPSKPKSYEGYPDPRTKEQIKSSLKPKSTIKTNKNFATPGTGFKDTSGTNNQPKTVTSGDRAKEALKKAVKTSVGISPFTAKTKKEKLYAGDVGQSKGGIVGSKGEDMTKQRRDNAQELEGISKGGTQPKNTNYTSMLPEFEVTATKMYGSPAKMDTVDPTTGQVLPADMGQGPTNVGNANTANTLQKQADAAAIKANRAGAPDRSASSISQTPMTMQGNFKNDSMAHASRMFGNVANPVPSPSQFNKGLRKASAQGKLDGNPSFKSKVDAAPIKAVPVGAIIKGVQAVGALKSAAKAKGNPEIKGTVLPELEVNYTPKITSGKTTDMTTGAERDSTAKEKASQEKELQSKGDGRTTTSYTNKDGKKVKLKESTKVSF